MDFTRQLQACCRRANNQYAAGRQLPGLPALGASAELRHHRSANHTWCEYYLTQPALQQAVYQYYRVDYELLQFDHPLPLTHACSGRARSRLGN